MSGREQALIAEAFASNYIAPVGPMVDQFEREFAARVGLPFALAVSSGTAALHLALRELGVGPGDEVYCSTLTFIASIAPAVQLGATPVFIDADEASWTLDPDLLEAALADGARRGKLPKAVVAVDLYGQCCDYERIRAMCDRHGVPLVEDAAEALGATYRGRPAGQAGRAAIYSFNGNKVITTSGGGMLASADERLISRARHLATQARETAPHYEHQECGYNYRMSNVLAAIGRAQLEVLNARVAAKRRIHALYRSRLGGLRGIAFMPEAAYGEHARWLSIVLLDEGAGCTPEAVRLALERANIESRPLWKPMHLQPVFRDARVWGGAVSERLFQRGLCLPSGTAMTDNDVWRVCEQIKACVKCA